MYLPNVPVGPISIPVMDLHAQLEVSPPSRHNAVRDLLAHLLTEVCNNVTVEPYT